MKNWFGFGVTNMRRTIYICLLFGFGIILGCGSSGPPLHHVKGVVQFAGQPLPYGTMSIEPDQGNTGPQSSVEIVDGAFDTKANNGKGVIAGKVLVRIMGFKDKPNPGSDEPLQPLFEDYTQQVEIPNGDSTKDFDVPPEAAAKKRNEDPVHTGGA